MSKTDRQTYEVGLIHETKRKFLEQCVLKYFVFMLGTYNNFVNEICTFGMAINEFFNKEIK